MWPQPNIIKMVEYIGSPIPTTLYKAMQLQYATELIEYGKLRISTFGYFRSREADNEQIGDITEGIGKREVNGMEITTNTSNPAFIYSMSSNADMRLDNLGPEYDAIVEISDFTEFGRRFASACNNLDRGNFGIQAGYACYDKGAASVRGSLHYNDNAFQKLAKHSVQYEYRFVVTNLRFHFQDQEHLYPVLGPCSDIVKIL
jgi:hypothetical protein